MSQQLSRLYSISRKETRQIIGLMSGTSLDGLDIALCAVSGSGLNTSVRLRNFATVPYSEEVKTRIRTVFARKEVDFQYLIVLNEWIGMLHAEMITNCLQEWGVAAEEVDCIASHGQTVFHAPAHQHGLPDMPNATLQIGDGDHIAVRTGIITLSDFRQKHLAAGGEGAPLAVYGDYLLFSKKEENRLMLNMGGIANFTYLPRTLDASSVFVTDTGPGNTLLDAFSQKLFGLPYDKDAALARAGTVHTALLNALKNNPFFDAPFPKTTGPEVFNTAYVLKAQQETGTREISGEDLLATLTAFSAETIVAAIRQIILPGERYSLYASGGGMHNPLLMAYIQQELPEMKLAPSDDLGISGDAKEAVLFAILANETLAGEAVDYGSREGVPSVHMGKISLPR
ncbi:anhydro-N-acetylmuramic acid kinase [Siphonobacter aquaeclarae]|uniref:Anhydro-N-acetylmuramic acid kinase n=1 Tax=Siphonobacter aquaeclarae TaxID=563176 RepID=A0A1G9NDM8_9BACT|nr:anhydro-N-acetylmuramic acid kinase [Siphonobacter aquaeclarae]SDL84494.1 anhydro-N-acetylmuramic acid kinase [Siphonobacter aquaeclarae]